LIKKYFSALLFLVITHLGFGQSNQLWKGYFSYNEIKDIAQSSTVFYAASENAMFSKNLATNVISTRNTIDGLSGQTITALYHSEALNKTMVGYNNGLIIVINEVDGNMLNVVDIINKQLPSNIKKVNHFQEYNGTVYVSCDFGIVQYNLATLGFGDTYFIGDGGAEIVVSQTAVFDGYLYAATSSGIRRADITNPNLVDFSQWTTVTTGTWTGIEAFNTALVAVTSTGQVNQFNGTDFTPYSQLPEAVADIRSSGSNLIITTASRVYVYNQSLSVVAQVENYMITEVSAQFTCATVIGDTLYIGTRENGVVTTSLTNPSTFNFLRPDGPERNNIFSINTASKNLWAVYGDYTVDYDPNPIHMFGLSKYNSENGWLNIPYSQAHPIDSEAYDFVRVTVNPTNDEQIFVSSYFSGLLEFQNDQLVNVYNETNSSLESIFPTDPPEQNIRIEQSAYDKFGNLWMTNAIVHNALKELRADGQWMSYSMDPIINDYASGRFGRMVIDKNNTKWICTTRDGLVAFNENGNIYKKITFGPDQGNLPVDDVRAVAIDTHNQIWIGTRSGLRVLSSVDRFLNDQQMTANPIIILEEGVAQELLYEQFITDIAVDGGNNKWVGTADSGVFLLSPNGQETLYRFTSSNSPLPSNTINDIEINGVTGEVFFATDKGMVSFKGTSTEASENLNHVLVYPNPVRPEFTGTVKISGLLDKANVKISDIEGNLVYETIAEGGTIEWDTTAFGKYRVASGVYMIFISAEDGGETKVKKVMIVR
jgi:hypothetical protein